MKSKVRIKDLCSCRGPGGKILLTEKHIFDKIIIFISGPISNGTDGLPLKARLTTLLK